MQLFFSVAVGILAAVAGNARFGSDGLQAGCVAAGVTGTAAIVALSLAAFTRYLAPLAISLAGTLVRMMTPFAAGLVLTNYFPHLADGGLMGMIVVCYLLNLVTETFLSLRVLVGRTSAGGV
jgi:hypothetical protein